MILTIALRVSKFGQHLYQAKKTPYSSRFLRLQHDKNMFQFEDEEWRVEWAGASPVFLREDGGLAARGEQKTETPSDASLRAQRNAGQFLPDNSSSSRAEEDQALVERYPELQYPTPDAVRSQMERVYGDLQRDVILNTRVESCSWDGTMLHRWGTLPCMRRWKCRRQFLWRRGQGSPHHKNSRCFHRYDVALICSRNVGNAGPAHGFFFHVHRSGDWVLGRAGDAGQLGESWLGEAFTVEDEVPPICFGRERCSGDVDYSSSVLREGNSEILVRPRRRRGRKPAAERKDSPSAPRSPCR